MHKEKDTTILNFTLFSKEYFPKKFDLSTFLMEIMTFRFIDS